MMPSHSDMAGDLQTCPQLVFAGNTSMSNTHCHVPEVHGFPSIRHNEIRDITATLLTEVCKDVCVEPDLQPVMPDQLRGASANRRDGARLDISANGVWGGRFEKTYFDVRGLNPIAPTNRN